MHTTIPSGGRLQERIDNTIYRWLENLQELLLFGIEPSNDKINRPIYVFTVVMVREVVVRSAALFQVSRVLGSMPMETVLDAFMSGVQRFYAVHGNPTGLSFLYDYEEKPGALVVTVRRRDTLLIRFAVPFRMTTADRDLFVSIANNELSQTEDYPTDWLVLGSVPCAPQ